MAELLAGEAETGYGVMTGREWAADTLKHVATHCEYGGYPQTVSAFDFGRALGRALSNCNEPNPHAELWRGLNHYLDNKKSGGTTDGT